jgi:hypothetical protein
MGKGSFLAKDVRDDHTPTLLMKKYLC